MTAQDVETLLQAHIDSNPYRTCEHYHPSEEALGAQVPGVSTDLIRQFYEKVQGVWPDVPPQLANRDDTTLRAWAAAAASRPELHWNSVLLGCWNGDPSRLRWLYGELLRLYQAPACPQLPSLPSDDSELVAAIRAQMGVPSVYNFPLGWAATALAEGSPQSVEAVHRHVVNKVEDPLLDGDLDDLRRLVPNPATAQARALLQRVDERLKERDLANGHDDFFASLGLAEVPAVFQLMAKLPGKGGQCFTLCLSRSWRTSMVSWIASAGKVQPRYTMTDRALLVNKLKLGRYTLSQLDALMADTAAAMKTAWVGPWEMEYEEGLESSLLPLLARRYPPAPRRRQSAKSVAEAPR